MQGVADLDEWDDGLVDERLKDAELEAHAEERSRDQRRVLLVGKETIVIELMTSDRKLQASREGSK